MGAREILKASGLGDIINTVLNAPCYALRSSLADGHVGRGVFSPHLFEKFLSATWYCKTSVGVYSWYHCFSLAELYGHQHCGWIRPKQAGWEFRVQGLGFNRVLGFSHRRQHYTSPSISLANAVPPPTHEPITSHGCSLVHPTWSNS